MKSVCMAIVSILIAGTPLSGQTGERKANLHSKPNSAKAAAALIQIEQEWHKALEKNDLAALDRVLAKEWIITNGSGAIFTKPYILAALRSGEIRFVSTVPSDIKVHLYKDAAVITKLSTDQTLYGKDPGGGRYQMTDMFVKIDGRWQCVATHASHDHKP